MKGQLNRSGQFGSLAVFMASISTILGAILFLRFGYAVGHVGFVGVLGIILLGHAVTIPTALAVSEISTNRKVEGGGFYYVISRSFGMNIGAPIGMMARKGDFAVSMAFSLGFFIIYCIILDNSIYQKLITNFLNNFFSFIFIIYI